MRDCLFPSGWGASRKTVLCLLALLACANCWAPGGDIRNSDNEGDDAAANCGAPVSVYRDPNLSTWTDVAIQGLLSNFYSSNNWSQGWGFAQAVDTLVDNLRVNQGRKYSGTLQTVFRAYQKNGYSNYGEIYYDDENWMALAFARAYTIAKRVPSLQTTATGLLEQSKYRFSIVQDGEQFDANNVSTGVLWSSKGDYRACVSNFGAVVTACDLYEITQDANYFAMATRVYDYFLRNGTNLEKFQVFDGAGGTTAQYTYGYGVAIGAALRMHQLTGDANYLIQARGFTNTALDKMLNRANDQNLLGDFGCKLTCGASGDGPLFMGITVRYLTEMSVADPNMPLLQELLNNSVQSAWTYGRDANKNLFSNNFSGPPQSSPTQGSSTSPAMAFSTMACTAPGILRPIIYPHIYEAEEAYLGLLGPQAGDANIYSGWGYAPQTSTDGKVVTFPLQVAHAGTQSVQIRYSTDGNAAVRVFSVDGIPIDTKYSFAKTSNLSTLATQSLELDMSAGVHSLSIGFQTSESSNGNINLDYATVRPKFTGENCPTMAPPQASAPIQAVGRCGDVNFTWSETPGATFYEVVLDNEIVCREPAPITQCTVSQSLLDAGTHVWYVAAINDCDITYSPVETFSYALQSVEKPSNVAVTAGTDAYRVQWDAPSPDAAAKTSVYLDGNLICSGLKVAQCSLNPNWVDATAEHTWLVTMQNVCSTKCTSTTTTP